MTMSYCGECLCDIQPAIDDRVLTLRPVWAWAVLHAGKRLENRSWSTSWRGWIWIHSGSAPTTDVERDVLRRSLRLLGIEMSDLDDFPRGAIVARARIADVIDNANRVVGQGPWQSTDGYAFLLAEVQQLAVPVSARGALNLWRYRP